MTGSGGRTAASVRSISAAERERLMKSSMVVEGKGRNAVQRFNMPMFRVKLAALAMVDRDGSRLFSEDDVAELGRKNARAMERVSDAALDLCGIVDDADAEDDDVGKGGSPMILNGGSDTTSVSPSAA